MDAEVKAASQYRDLEAQLKVQSEREKSLQQELQEKECSEASLQQRVQETEAQLKNGIGIEQSLQQQVTILGEQLKAQGASEQSLQQRVDEGEQKLSLLRANKDAIEQTCARLKEDAKNNEDTLGREQKQHEEAIGKIVQEKADAAANTSSRLQELEVQLKQKCDSEQSLLQQMQEGEGKLNLLREKEEALEQNCVELKRAQMRHEEDFATLSQQKLDADVNASSKRQEIEGQLQAKNESEQNLRQRLEEDAKKMLHEQAEKEAELKQCEEKLGEALSVIESLRSAKDQVISEKSTELAQWENERQNLNQQVAAMREDVIKERNEWMQKTSATETEIKRLQLKVDEVESQLEQAKTQSSQSLEGQAEAVKEKELELSAIAEQHGAKIRELEQLLNEEQEKLREEQESASAQMQAFDVERNAFREEKEGVESSFAQEKMAWVQEKTEYKAKVEAGEASYAGKIAELQKMMEGSTGLASALRFSS